MKKAKKFLLNLLAFASVSAFALGITACGEDRDKSNGINSNITIIDWESKYIFDNGTVIGLKDKTLNELVIPDSINGVPVSAIGESAFASCSWITSVSISDSVTNIENRAFADCHSLNSIILPTGLTEISDETFDGCWNLNSVILPDGLTHIGEYAFYGCESLKNIELPNSLISIEDYAFGYCSFISIEIPSSVNNIGTDIFRSCYKLVEVINKSDVEIRGWCDDLGGFDPIYIHNGESKVVNIDDYLFITDTYTTKNVHYLVGYIGTETKIVLPDNYNGENYEIGRYAFASEEALTSLVISKGVIAIGEAAFRGCDFVSVTVPKNVEKIGEDAFWACRRLVEIINKSDLNIEKGSQDYGCIGLYALYVHEEESKIVNKEDFLFVTDENNNHYLLGYIGNNTKLSLPKNYNGKSYEIYDTAFEANKMLSSVNIPNSVTKIGSWAFYGCTSLARISFTGTVAEWNEIEKGEYWNDSVPAAKVVCSDGEVAL